MGHINIRVAPVTPAEAYLGVANDFATGMRILLSADPMPALTLTAVGGHALECGLKAFLAHAGIDEKALGKAPYSHNVINLWEETSARGLNLESPRPAWVDQLDRVYASPFVARYPMGVNGVVLPNLRALVAGVEQILRDVRSSIR